MQGRDRILIIEDDPAVGESLRDSLTSNGFHAKWKSSGGEGIRHAQSESPDLVILDVRLPDGSGFDFFRQMRQMRLRQPISILTARREEADKIFGLEIGADDYLTKPYSPGELLAWVRALLASGVRRIWPPGTPTLCTPETWLSTGAEAMSAEEIRFLTSRPPSFVCLSILAQNAGQVVSRGQISGRRVGLRRRHSERKSRQRPHPTPQREGRA